MVCLHDALPISVSAGFGLADGLRTLLPSARRIDARFVSPGIDLLTDAAARGEFPFGFPGQADAHGPLFRQPVAERHGIEPVHMRHWRSLVNVRLLFTRRGFSKRLPIGIEIGRASCRE